MLSGGLLVVISAFLWKNEIIEEPDAFIISSVVSFLGFLVSFFERNSIDNNNKSQSITQNNINGDNIIGDKIVEKS